MRRIFLLTFSLLALLFYLVPVSIYAFSEDSTGTPSAESVNYDLPYPGILPDNPLYIFKVIRDRAVGFLISSPLKKAEFNLLQADKRLNAGISLFNKDKTSLAYSTISKAENYFSEAIDELRKAKEQKLIAGGVEGRLENALKKHQQEVSNLMLRTDNEFKESFRNELKRMEFFEERLNK